MKGLKLFIVMDEGQEMRNLINFTEDIRGYLVKLKNTVDALKMDEINVFINLLITARNEGRTVFVMGNGGSASTASHFCCDFNKGTSYNCNTHFKFICLNDNIPTLMAYSNDVGWETALVEPLKNFFQSGDYVIGISCSGNSRNVINAVEYANDHGGVTIGLTGYQGGKLKQACRYSINVNVNDMQISEDLHMIINHLTSRVILGREG